MRSIDIQSIIVFDIETVPGARSLNEASAELQAAWRRSVVKRNLRRGQSVAAEDAYCAEAGLNAAFGRVVAFALATFDDRSMKVYGVGSHDERGLLTRFLDCCAKVDARSRDRLSLVGHNIRGFDIPYLARRMLAHSLEVPEVLTEAQGKPEWFSRHEDTLELWNFASRDRVSLDTICAALGIVSPKGGIEGSKVRDAFYEEDALEQITDYCARDVEATAHVFRRLKQMPPIDSTNVSTTIEVGK